jgi:predicted nucleotidyltransferase
MDAWKPADEANRERARVLLEEARRIADALAERGASRVVAFGSLVRNDGGPVHDIDLLVVIETAVPWPDRPHRLLEGIPTSEPVDLLAYTPREFDLMRRRAFVRDALANGIVLHEKPAA